MTWWATLLVSLLPVLAATTVGVLTWRSLHAQQSATALKESATAVQLDIANLEELRCQVNSLWQERTDYRDRLAVALDDLRAARADAVRLGVELQQARDDLHAAAADISKLRQELNRARERIVLLEREVVRLGGNPDTLGGQHGKRRT